MDLCSLIRTVPHYPRQGVMFRDITTLLHDAHGFADTIARLADHYAATPVDLIAGIEARGFIIGAALALRMQCGFIPIRKKGKLPAEVVGYNYELEYGADRIEMHIDAVTPGMRVLLVDDLIATGGTAYAACRLIETMKGHLVGCAFVIDLPALGGHALLEEKGYSVYTLCHFEGD